MKSYLDVGVYSLPEASRLAKVHPRTVSRWVVGEAKGTRGKLLQTDLPVVNKRRALTFLDLIDLLVVGRFRENGVPLQTVRRVYDRLAGAFETSHPFGHRRVLTDGKSVFMETLDTMGDKHLEEVLGGQRAMSKVLEPYLKQIEYEPITNRAARWNISEGIVLDPNRSFGKPVLESDGVTTHVLAAAYHANNHNVELIADLYNVSPKAVFVAVEFESRYTLTNAA